MAKKNLRKPTQQPATGTTGKQTSSEAGTRSLTVTKVSVSETIERSKRAVNAVDLHGFATTATQPTQPLFDIAPTGLPDKVTVVAQVPVLAEPRVKVRFVMPPCPCAARHVALSGDFNNWSPDATPMKRHDDGHWETTIELAPGRHEYKFVCDGEWMPDLLARENVLNPHGTLNSVIQVQR